jgi:hypothetical protein
MDEGLTNDTVYSLATNGTFVFAGTYNSVPNYRQGYHEAGVLRSSDNGASWKNFKNALTNTNVFALTVFGHHVFAGTDCCGVFRSDDSGVNWIQVNSGLSNLDIRAFLTVGSSLFVGTNGGGIFYSLDSGQTWMALDSNLVCAHVYALAASRKYLFAGTMGAGVFRYPLSSLGLSSVSKSEHINYGIKLYPNPTHSRTDIVFTYASVGHADIRVVNMLGTEVARIFSGELDASEHTFTWHADKMQPGMYECIVRMNGMTQTTPIIVE